MSDYFIPSSYKDASGKENKCYEVTKIGCDFLANKFTGEKGILFTARYVKRFDDMENHIKESEENKPKLLYGKDIEVGQIYVEVGGKYYFAHLKCDDVLKSCKHIAKL